MKRTSRRRGANAIEFALVMPVFLTMVFGMADYGWYYFQHALSTNAVVSAMRVGALTRPTDAEQGMGTCAACISKVQTMASENLKAIGVAIEAQDLQPTLENVGGVCTLVLEPTIPHEPLIGLVAVPNHYTFRSAVIAQAVLGC